MLRRTRGFTLIEILVVLVIIAIITSVAVMAFGSFGRNRREQYIAHGFERAIAAAEQQAILTSTALGLGITAQGYQFFQYELSAENKPGVWNTLTPDNLSNVNAFRHMLTPHVSAIGYYGEAEKKSHGPVILFLPSGFVTPFTVYLSGKKDNYIVIVDNAGNVTIKSQ